MVDDSEYKTSILTLTPKEYSQYYDNFIKKNNDIIRKHINYLDFMYIRKPSITRLCFENGSFINSFSYYTLTNIKCSKGDVYIPIEYHILMKAILSKSIHIAGFLRKPAPIQKLNDVYNILIVLIINRIDPDDIYEIIEHYDVLLLGSLFKKLFTHNKSYLIPNSYHNIIIMINNMEEGNDKHVISKFVIFSLPLYAIMFFDSLRRFLTVVLEKINEHDDTAKLNVDFKGVLKILLPNFCNLGVNNYTIDQIKNLLNGMDYIYSNSAKFVSLEDMYLN